jgi:hypothetical protein
MRIPTRWSLIVLAATASLWAVAPAGAVGARQAATRAAALPERLTDADFWALSRGLSESDGFFRSDNLVSNEVWLQWVIPDLTARVKPGGVYLGVGPEQNFTYIAAMRPKMVFLTDVRRGNLQMHLMYKALFEMSETRADFMSRLFTKPRPPGLTTKSSATELVGAYWDQATSPEAVYKANLAAVLAHLTTTRRLPLEQADLEGIEYIYWSFYWYGPAINYSSSTNGRGMVSYGDLMLASDASGLNRAFLASEAAFRVLKDLHQRNLIVPVVGNLAGPKALRAIGQDLRERGATVSAMYLSNVEQYLVQDGLWSQFCANIASMPLDDTSTFIRSSRGGGAGRGGGGSGLVNSLGGMLAETRGCTGHVPDPIVQ